MPNLVLRATLYTQPDDPAPVTLVVRASDLAHPIRQAADTLERDSARWGFVVTDLFEVDDATYASHVRSTLAGAGRLDGERKRAERDMCVSFFWNVEKLRLVVARGALINPGRAPLTIDQLQVVMRQITRRAEYQGQVLSFRACDDRILTYREGEFITLDPPSRSVT